MFARIEDAIKAFQSRCFVIIFNENEGPEGEGDLCIPAAGVTAEAILTMARVASGLICLALSKKRLEELEIDALPSKYQPRPTPFFESVDAADLNSSGISPRDRCHTIKKVIDPATRPKDLGRPGHVQLLGAHADGLIGRNGHTEAVVELCQLAGLYPGAVLAEIISDRGDMMNAKELKALARKFKIPIITVGALAEFVRSLLPKRKAAGDLTFLKR